MPGIRNIGDCDTFIVYKHTNLTNNKCYIGITKRSLDRRVKDGYGGSRKFNNALKIINDTDIYKYHYKNEKDNIKKNIGIVIGDKYKYSTEITNEDNTGMNVANMIGVCFQAIKEQQQMILELQNEIEKLKEDK